MSQTPNGGTTSQFDAAQIATLRALRGGTLLPRLLGLYREQTAPQLTSLAAAAAAGDTAALIGIAHSLKSSSFSVGAARVGALCASLESAGRSGTLPDGGRELARQIGEAYAALLPELEDLLA